MGELQTTNINQFKNCMKTKTNFRPTTLSTFTIGFLLLSTFLSACKNNNEDFDASGSFESTEVIVSAEASGKIINFDITEGQLLEQNQEIGHIDSVQLALRKKQIQANQKGLQSRRPNVQKQIASLEQQIATAKNEKKRFENLVAANAANTKQLDDIKAQIAVLEKQLIAHLSTLESTNTGISEDSEALNIQIEQIDDQLQKCKIISPIKGTVLQKYAEAGEVTMPGKALCKVADIENMILRAYITSDQLNKLKIGQKVKVSADFGEDEMRTYEGTIAWISSKAEFTPKTIATRDERANMVYAIKINIKNDGFLKIGMYGNVNF